MEKKAIVAGGCFWGMEELFRNLSGVLKTEVGYTGGDLEFPKYEDITTGVTGHAEAIEIIYKDDEISYKEILQFFFKIHDPTSKNRQGNDIGTQYRSAIFFMDDREKETSLEVIKEIDESGKWSDKITTTLEKYSKFYSAEEVHQKYLIKNPGGYSCHYIRD